MARRTEKSGKRIDRKGAMGSMIMLSYDRGARSTPTEAPKRIDRKGAMGSMIMLNYKPEKGRK